MLPINIPLRASCKTTNNKSRFIGGKLLQIVVRLELMLMKYGSHVAYKHFARLTTTIFRQFIFLCIALVPRTAT
jgi:hypothetical protein